jgi:hypothetical protein
MTVRLIFACDGDDCMNDHRITLEAFTLDAQMAKRKLEDAGWTFKRHQRAPRIRALCPRCAIGDKR